MSRAADIERMFARIGITDGRYQEFESAEDPAEALATWALLNSAGEAEAGGGASPPADMPDEQVPRPTSFHERVAELRRRPAGLTAARAAEAMPAGDPPAPTGRAAGHRPREDGTVVQTRRIVPRRPPPAEDSGATGMGVRPPTILPHRTPTVVPRRPLRAAPPPSSEPLPVQNDAGSRPPPMTETERTVAVPRRPAAAAPPEEATVLQQRRPAAAPPEERTMMQPRPTASPAGGRTVSQPRPPAPATPPEAATVLSRRTAAPPEERTMVQPRAERVPRQESAEPPSPRVEPAEALRRELRAGLGAGQGPQPRRTEEVPESRRARIAEPPPSKTPLQRVFARLDNGPAGPDHEAQDSVPRRQTPLSQIFRRLS